MFESQQCTGKARHKAFADQDGLTFGVPASPAGDVDKCLATRCGRPSLPEGLIRPRRGPLNPRTGRRPAN